ncbi:MAG: hypothetical protein FWG34_08920 [Oscillospiraceae bacterium]|jgi:outer membrane lipoprotein-sorting protein|nr:hypothetical protein [Oscillospiraceae bacterium]
MKKIILSAFFAMLALLFSSCGERAVKNIPTETIFDDGTAALAENDSVDFYFYYPENFTMQRNDAMITVYINDSEIIQIEALDPGSAENFKIETKPNLSATVFALPEGKYETIEKYWNEFGLPSYETVFQDLEGEPEETLTIDGVEAKKYTYTLSVAGMKYKISQIVFFKKRQVYTLTYTATETKYETHANVLQIAAETFRFKQ